MKYLYYSVVFLALVSLLVCFNLFSLNRQLSQLQSLASNQYSSTTSDDHQTLLKKISQLDQEIINLKIHFYTKAPIEISQTTPTPYTSTSLPMLEIADSKWQTIDVFEKPLASSKVISQANYGTIYFYESSQAGWYQIHLDLDTLGWIQSQFVKELSLQKPKALFYLQVMLKPKLLSIQLIPLSKITKKQSRTPQISLQLPLQL